MPPRLILLLLVAATATHLALRYPWHPVSMPVGTGLVALGMAINLWADGLFRSEKTPIRPGERPERLVVRGPFRVTRNPMYLGMLASLAGIALAVGSWPFWVPPVVFFIAAARFYIPLEEGQMQARFADDYVAYRARVGRWL